MDAATRFGVWDRYLIVIKEHIDVRPTVVLAYRLSLIAHKRTYHRCNKKSSIFAFRTNHE